MATGGVGIDEHVTESEIYETTTQTKLVNVLALRTKVTSTRSAITKKRNEISKLMLQTDSLHLVKTAFEEFNNFCLNYHDCFSVYFDNIVDEDLQTRENKKHEDIELSIHSFREQVSNWIHRNEQLLLEQCDRSSVRGGSRHSASSRSSHSGRIKEKARIAGLVAEKEMLEQTKRVMALQIDIEIAKSKAREKVFDEAEADNDNEMQHLIQPSSSLNPQAEVFQLYHDQPQSQSRTNETDINSLMLQTHRQMATAMLLPQPIVPKFSGDPVEYGTFVMAFDARIVPNTSSDTDRLYFLDQQLEGEPKDLIGGCMFMDPSSGYTCARELLAKEYGDPYKVATAYMNRVLAWPDVKYDDSTALKQLSVFLIKCQHAMKSLSHLNVLNYAPNLQAIVHKLPVHMQNKWRDHVTKLRSQGRNDIDFKEIVNFVDFAAKSANEPVFGKVAMSGLNHSKLILSKVDKKPNKFHHTKPNASNFVANVKNDTPCHNAGNGERYVTCYYCGSRHDIDNCIAFGKLSIAEKRSFLMDKRMCFCCYGRNHTAKGCMRKRICSKCSKRHPTALHDDNFQLSKDTYKDQFVKDVPDCTPTKSSNSTSCHTTIPHKHDTVLQPVLPVQIRQQGNDKCITTYALLDSGSTGCFISEELSEQLNATCQDTTLKLQTMHGVEVVKSSAVNNLVVCDVNGDFSVTLPKTFTRVDIPVGRDQIPKPDFLNNWSYLQDVSGVIPPYDPELSVGLLIGNNAPLCLQPLKVVPSQKDGPFAVRFRHGWTISGPLHLTIDPSAQTVSCNTVVFREPCLVKECFSPESVLKMFERDFSEHDIGKVPGERGYSQQDQQFMSIAESNVKFTDKHFQLPLPLKDQDLSIGNNKEQAETRAKWQKKKMLQNEHYYQDYVKFMEKLFSEGYAYKVPSEELSAENNCVRYLPHHGIYHPKKPGKIRVVFDCSAKYKGYSLNDFLLQGPDLTNSLIGVLTRFRLDSVAFMGDIEAMFYQVKVPQHQHDLLRFLWWPNGDLTSPLEEYRMSVHIFGAVSSPSIANYALKTASKNSETKYGPEVADTIKRHFYVDDCLKSVEDVNTAVELLNNLIAACDDGGFKLCKITCNSKDVLKGVPAARCSKDIQSCDLDRDELPIERALGMKWNINNDTFMFSVQLPEKPPTRRGILSTVSSLYDPLGLVCPVILPAKKILQDLCKLQTLGWDDEIPFDLLVGWNDWLKDFPSLSDIIVPRCVKPPDFGPVKSREIHLFSDASSSGYGCAAYLRLYDVQDNVHVSFLMGKSRLAPIKATTIPRLELTAATVAVQLAQQLRQELDLEIDSTTYYTDSTTVLHYIKSESKRFPVFVSNRVRVIRDFSSPIQWKYVDTANNPGDIASRGANARKLSSHHMWFNGPNFLWSTDQISFSPPFSPEDEPENFEHVALTSNDDVTDSQCDSMNKLIEHYSDWFRLKKAVAVYVRLFQILQFRVKQKREQVKEQLQVNQPFSVNELQNAEKIVISHVQRTFFPSEVHLLQKPVDKRGRVQSVSKNSSIYRLDPFIEDGILKVGGRLRRSQLTDESKHQLLLPHKCHVTTLVIQDIHRKLGHAGRNHVLSALRDRYWVIKSNSAVRNVLSKCVICKRLHGLPVNQRMADLPGCRVTPAAPFTYTGLDFFGPHLVKEGRKTLKRYGVIFTCLSSRAIHIETATSLDTDSFINSLRRFLARRGPIHSIYCDNGTNLTSAAKEFNKALSQMNQDQIRTFLLRHKIEWHFNPPGASHMGGSWERMIRTVRRVLSPLLQEYGERLDDESYRTLLTEVESIVNSRPFGTVSDSVDDLSPLTPNHLLYMKSDVSIPPPGVFQRTDVYMRKRWRRIQYLANQFWTRWQKEYLYTLQERQKWIEQKNNMKVNDIVLLRDDNLPRSCWSMGRVIDTEPDKQGIVRSVKVQTQSNVLRRPVSKLVTLLSD